MIGRAHATSVASAVRRRERRASRERRRPVSLRRRGPRHLRSLRSKRLRASTEPSVARTNARTDSSPEGVRGCIFLHSRTGLVARNSLSLRLAASAPAGLLIPRSKVRILHGPCQNRVLARRRARDDDLFAVYSSHRDRKSFTTFNRLAFSALRIDRQPRAPGCACSPGSRAKASNRLLTRRTVRQSGSSLLHPETHGEAARGIGSGFRP
jgi:hypothetical protein